MRYERRGVKGGAESEDLSLHTEAIALNLYLEIFCCSLVSFVRWKTN